MINSVGLQVQSFLHEKSTKKYFHQFLENPLNKGNYFWAGIAGRYTKRPAIAQTRITSFINNIVTFWYEDHKDKCKINIALPALDFIGKLVAHIHDHHFKQIRYSGLLAARSRSANLERSRVLLNLDEPQMWLRTSWSHRIRAFSGNDPLTCPKCKLEMTKTQIHFPNRGDPIVLKKVA